MASYEMKSGFKFDYDPSKCLPPDPFSEGMGYEAGVVINTIHYLRRVLSSKRRVTTVLSLGVGTEANKY